MDQQALQEQLTTLLQAGDTIEASWDCGHDEAIITIVHNGQTADSFDNTPKWIWDLDFVLMNLLSLPSAGEFSMVGKGSITLQEGVISLVCESRWKGYEGEDGWKEIDDYESEYSGTFQLFE